MTGCGDCRLSNGRCPHTGHRCTGYAEHRDMPVDDHHEHTARAGPRIVRGAGGWNIDDEWPTDICRCGAYRLWHITKPGIWRPGPIPSREW